MQNNEEIEILADIPGLHKEDIIVDVDSNTVSLDVVPPTTSTAPPGSLSANPRIKHSSFSPSLAHLDSQARLAQPDHGAAADALPQRGQQLKLHFNERCSRFTRRSLVLPPSADLRRASAAYRDGVLQILVPKLEAAPPKRLRVM